MCRAFSSPHGQSSIYLVKKRHAVKECVLKYTFNSYLINNVSSNSTVYSCWHAAVYSPQYTRRTKAYTVLSDVTDPQY